MLCLDGHKNPNPLNLLFLDSVLVLSKTTNFDILSPKLICLENFSLPSKMPV